MESPETPSRQLEGTADYTRPIDPQTPDIGDRHPRKRHGQHTRVPEAIPYGGMTRKTTMATDALTAGIEASVAATARTAAILKDFSKATDNFAGRYTGQEDQRVADAISKVVSDALVAFYHNNYSTTRLDESRSSKRKETYASKLGTPLIGQKSIRTPSETDPMKPTPAQTRARDDLRVLVTLSQEALHGPREDSFTLRASLIQKINTLTMSTILAVTPTMKGWAIKTADLATRDILLTEANSETIREIFHGIKVATPEEWFNYVVPLVPSAFHGIFGIINIGRKEVIEEALAQTGESPVRCDISRHGANPLTGKASWILSFKKKVKPFTLFTPTTRARLIDNKPRITRHTPGCQGWCNPVKCTRDQRCETCGSTREKHLGPMGPGCENNAKCANCHGPHKASHDNCPARPKVHNGKVVKPTRAELIAIRKASHQMVLAAKSSVKSKDSELFNSSSSSKDSSLPEGPTLDAAAQDQASENGLSETVPKRGLKRTRGEQVTAYENAGSTPSSSQSSQETPGARRSTRESAKPANYNIKALSQNSITLGSSQGLQGSRYSLLDLETEAATRPESDVAIDEEMEDSIIH